MSKTSKEHSLSDKPKREIGFRIMDAAKQREIASMGGRRAHELGVAHEFNEDEARRAGRKGGQASRGGRGKLRDRLDSESK